MKNLSLLLFTCIYSESLQIHKITAWPKVRKNQYKIAAGVVICMIGSGILYRNSQDNASNIRPGLGANQAAVMNSASDASTLLTSLRLSKKQFNSLCKLVRNPQTNQVTDLQYITSALYPDARDLQHIPYSSHRPFMRYNIQVYILQCLQTLINHDTNQNLYANEAVFNKLLLNISNAAKNSAALYNIIIYNDLFKKISHTLNLLDTDLKQDNFRYSINTLLRTHAVNSTDKQTTVHLEKVTYNPSTNRLEALQQATNDNNSRSCQTKESYKSDSFQELMNSILLDIYISNIDKILLCNIEYTSYKITILYDQQRQDFNIYQKNIRSHKLIVPKTYNDISLVIEPHIITRGE